MMLAGRDDIRVTETDEEILVFDVSDDVLERAAPIIGGVASVATLNLVLHRRQLRLPRIDEGG